MSVEVIDPKDALKEWNRLFDDNPWLEKWEGNNDCNVFCCPGSPPNWQALDGVRVLLWIFGKDTDIQVIRRNLITKKDLKEHSTKEQLG